MVPIHRCNMTAAACICQGEIVHSPTPLYIKKIENDIYHQTTSYLQPLRLLQQFTTVTTNCSCGLCICNPETGLYFFSPRGFGVPFQMLKCLRCNNRSYGNISSPRLPTSSNHAVYRVLREWTVSEHCETSLYTGLDVLQCGRIQLRQNARGVN